MMNRQLGGLILAGGQGSRMDYCNKGLAGYLGGRLFEPALAVLKKTCAHVAISANRDTDTFRHYCTDVIPDENCWKGSGPLSGIASSIGRFPSEINAIQILPCDAPLLNTEVVERLAAAFSDSGAPAVFAQTAEQMHPVVCQLKRDAIGSLRTYLSRPGGTHSIRRWLHQIEAQAVWFDESEWFCNINDRAALAALENRKKRI